MRCFTVGYPAFDETAPCKRNPKSPKSIFRHFRGIGFLLRTQAQAWSCVHILNRTPPTQPQPTQDGGCTCPGDVSKAFGAGADFVMLGGMLAGHDESGGDIIEIGNDKFKVCRVWRIYSLLVDCMRTIFCPLPSSAQHRPSSLAF